VSFDFDRLRWLAILTPSLEMFVDSLEGDARGGEEFCERGVGGHVDGVGAEVARYGLGLALDVGGEGLEKFTHR
jgi:hypothetical protein